MKNLELYTCCENIFFLIEIRFQNIFLLRFYDIIFLYHGLNKSYTDHGILCSKYKISKKIKVRQTYNFYHSFLNINFYFVATLTW